MNHIKLFENFEIVEQPINYGEPLNNREINFLEGYNIMCPEFILKDDNYYYIHDHRCENIKDLPLTYIHGICRKYDIRRYTINDNHTIDVDGNVYMGNEDFTRIPLKFISVSGHFLCGYNQLKTLEGSPEYVGGSFGCSNNKLTSLEGGPKRVEGGFNCRDNKLTTLEGSPEYVSRGFCCSFNQLTTLVGGPFSVDLDFDCRNNKLTTLEGAPKYVGGNIICYENPLVSTRYKGNPIRLGGGRIHFPSIKSDR